MLTLIINAVSPYTALNNVLKYYAKGKGIISRVIVVADSPAVQNILPQAEVIVKTATRPIGLILNELLAEDKNRYWLYVQQDSCLLSGCIEKAVRVFEQDERMGMLLPRTNTYHDEDFIYKMNCASWPKLVRAAERINASDDLTVKPTLSVAGYGIFLQRERLAESSSKFPVQYETTYFMFQAMLLNLWQCGLVGGIMSAAFIYNGGKHTAALAGHALDRIYFSQQWAADYEKIMGRDYNVAEQLDVCEPQADILYIGRAMLCQLLRLLDKFPDASLYGLAKDIQAELGGQLAELQEWNLQPEAFPYADKKFSWIIVDDILENTDDIEKLLAFLREFLTANGRLLLIVPNIKAYNLLNDIMNDEYCRDNYEKRRFFSQGEIGTLVKKAGYNVDNIGIVKIMVPAAETLRRELGERGFFIVRAYRQNLPLAFLLRRLEYGIEVQASAAALRDGLRQGEYGFGQVLYHLKTYIYYREQLLSNLLAAWPVQCSEWQRLCSWLAQLAEQDEIYRSAANLLGKEEGL